MSVETGRGAVPFETIGNGPASGTGVGSPCHRAGGRSLFFAM